MVVNRYELTFSRPDGSHNGSEEHPQDLPGGLKNADLLPLQTYFCLPPPLFWYPEKALVLFETFLMVLAACLKIHAAYLEGTRRVSGVSCGLFGGYLQRVFGYLRSVFQMFPLCVSAYSQQNSEPGRDIRFFGH